MQPKPEIDKLFLYVLWRDGSDLYLEPDMPPCMERLGVRQQLEMEPLSQDILTELLEPILSPQQRTWLEQRGEVRFRHALGSFNGVFQVHVVKHWDRLTIMAHQLAS